MGKESAIICIFARFFRFVSCTIISANTSPKRFLVYAYYADDKKIYIRQFWKFYKILSRKRICHFGFVILSMNFMVYVTHDKFICYDSVWGSVIYKIIYSMLRICFLSAKAIAKIYRGFLILIILCIQSVSLIDNQKLFPKCYFQRRSANFKMLQMFFSLLY